MSKRIFIRELLRVGDRVVLDVDPGSDYVSNRLKSWHGKAGTIISFNMHETYIPRYRGFGGEPGRYKVLGHPLVRFDDGSGDVINPSLLLFENPDLHAIRQQERTGFEQERGLAQVRVSDLPDLPFWEKDVVKIVCDGGWDDAEHELITINYDDFGKPTHKGTPFPIYEVRLATGGYCRFAEADLQLVRRGNLWKHYHRHLGEAPSFSDLVEEAVFARELGQAHEVKNPYQGPHGRGAYRWTLNQALRAVKEGVGDAFVASPSGIRVGATGETAVIRVYKFNDVDLGNRLRAETLEEFKHQPKSLPKITA